MQVATGESPQWGETFAFDFATEDQLKGSRFRVSVWDSHHVHRDRFMGMFCLWGEEVLDFESKTDGFFILLDESRGELYGYPSRTRSTLSRTNTLHEIPETTLPASSEFGDLSPDSFDLLSGGSSLAAGTSVAQQWCNPCLPCALTSRSVFTHPPSGHVLGVFCCAVLGKGNFGKVFLATFKDGTVAASRGSVDTFALKVLKKKQLADAEDVHSALSEQHALSVCRDCSFIVTLHASFQTPANIFFLLELVHGGDLMFHVQSSGCFTEERAAFTAAEICCGLWFLHDHGIMYRDLKLDNVLVGTDGHMKLTDFNLAKVGLARGDMAYTLCGTPDYLAPEVVEYHPYT